ncbi:MAG: 4'-phosphopantetheinyl transferase superfamily protein [Steroidobacteraceae bacterium]
MTHHGLIMGATMMPSIAQLLPAGVASAEVEGEEPHGYLLAQEAAQIRGAVRSRRQEFTAARTCARQALRELGLPETAILRGEHREPLWPAGVVGSITHCPGYRAAAAAKIADALALGIDAEVHDKLPANVLERVSNPEERAWLSSAPKGLHWDRVLFSAKESLYKAWFPLTRRKLGFDEVSVSFEPGSGAFAARLRVAPVSGPDLQFCTFAGRFLVDNGLVLTAAVLQPHA